MEKKAMRLSYDPVADVLYMSFGPPNSDWMRKEKQGFLFGITLKINTLSGPP